MRERGAFLCECVALNEQKKKTREKLSLYKIIVYAEKRLGDFFSFTSIIFSKLFSINNIKNEKKDMMAV